MPEKAGPMILARLKMDEFRETAFMLDEPSTGIDVKSQAELYPFLKKLNEEQGITVVTVEHNLKAAMRNSTHMKLTGLSSLYQLLLYSRSV